MRSRTICHENNCSILVSMLASRSQIIRMLKRDEPNMEDSAFLPKLVAYCSTEAHSCVEKAAMISLVKLRVIEPDERCCLRGASLEAAITQDIANDLVPFYVATTLGTTGSCAFDNLVEIGQVCKRYSPFTLLHLSGTSLHPDIFESTSFIRYPRTGTFQRLFSINHTFSQLQFIKF